jgi:hypothetical protein
MLQRYDCNAHLNQLDIGSINGTPQRSGSRTSRGAAPGADEPLMFQPALLGGTGPSRRIRGGRPTFPAQVRRGQVSPRAKIRELGARTEAEVVPPSRAPSRFWGHLHRRRLRKCWRVGCPLRALHIPLSPGAPNLFTYDPGVVGALNGPTKQTLVGYLTASAA